MAASPRASARKRPAPAKARRDLLLDEAARQFNASGVSQTSLAEVADTLGVSRAALYYYVEDREDLVFQVYRRSCEVMSRHLGTAARSGRTAFQVIEDFVAAVLDPDEPEIAALSEIGLLRPAERETVLALYEGMIARLAGVLEAGEKRGELRSCDFAIAARVIVSILHWIPVSGRWTPAADAHDRRALIKTIVDVLARGCLTNRKQTLAIPVIDLSGLRVRPTNAFDREGIAEAKKETILAAASRLFNRKGVDSASLDEIAAELGATKRTLYHYVGDKQAILMACFARAHRIYLYVHKLSMALHGSPAAAAIANFRATAIAQQTEEFEPLRPVIGTEALPAEEQPLAAKRSRELSRNFIVRYDKALAAGEVRDIDKKLMLLILPGATAWLAKGIVVGDEKRRAEIAEEVSNVVYLGLKRL